LINLLAFLKKILIKKGKFDKLIKTLFKKPRKFYRTNQYISAQKVRVIDAEGKQIGILNINQALTKAQEAKLDLVEVAARTNPPVCKIIDFKKFKYLEAKKQQEEKKKIKKSELKEIRLTLFIAENDLNFRAKKIEKFLKEGHKVKINLMLKGRQITKKDLAYTLFRKVIDKVRAFSKIETEPKIIGKKLEMTLAPEKNRKNEKKEIKNQKIN